MKFNSNTFCVDRSLVIVDGLDFGLTILQKFTKVARRAPTCDGSDSAHVSTYRNFDGVVLVATVTTITAAITSTTVRIYRRMCIFGQHGVDDIDKLLFSIVVQKNLGFKFALITSDFDRRMDAEGIVVGRVGGGHGVRCYYCGVAAT